MTQMDLFQTAISLPLDTHVSHFHKQGSEEAQKMTDISGRSFFPLFKAKDPLGAFSRMFMGTSLWGSTKCYLTWRGKATPQGRSLFQLVPRTHLTDEIDSGSSVEMWATPRTSDVTSGRTLNEKGQRISKSSDLVFGANLADQVKMWPTPTANNAGTGEFLETLTDKNGKAPKQNERVYNPKTGKHTQVTLNRAVAMWPTPRASAGMNDSMQSANKQVNKKGYKHKLEQAVAMWPTPAARDYKGANSYERTKNKLEQGERAQMGQLPNAVMMQEGKQISGSLNPQWVEWLMGYPEGWTDLKD